VKLVDKPAPFDPARLRSHRRHGNGWRHDDGRTPLRWVGCDCCGRTPRETPRAFALRHDLGTRWIVCRLCVTALTTPVGRKRWWRR
jgi:hypothetical protein